MKKIPYRRPRSAPGRQQATALRWLGHDNHAAGMLATARLHMQVQATVAKILPPALGEVCRVARLETDKLQLAVPSAAHAAKLRQMAPRVAQALAAAGWHLNEISVKVHAGLLPPAAPPPPREAAPLDDRALEAFATLQKNLRPGTLADAVARLLKHHKPGSGS
ncbi:MULTISPECIES: DciA family protein [unclassified Achromobacter]|uniref:DciA family protein n=1 Tax=unclassified Achromobacter TaxID=2626865 RepID=UPI000B51DB19|nr:MULTISPECIES: DciA family protein [unclassified Achromobacter]OWT72678.1 flagellar hook-length control protein FliK [Achromobacter sp. HZ34]OWT73895.1 flagellar hook-length control protein FliK [Achromobacter sp. HZ28]